MFWKNNWLQYSYDGVNDLKIKKTPSSIWKLIINKTIDAPLKSYKEELLLNAQTIRENFSEPFDLLLSGGVDSEVVLKCYVESKIPINVFVCKYKDNINQEDFQEALTTCNIYGIKPNIIEFDLKHFVENDAHDMWNKGYFAAVGYMINMKLIEYLDNIPIIGDGINADNFEIQKKSCNMVIHEKHFSGAIYGNLINRPILSSWFDYSPEVLASFLDLNLHKWKKHQLIQPPFDNANLHKLKYINFNKILGTRIRKKRTGWESVNFLDDFTQKHIKHFVSTRTFTKELNEFRGML